MFTYRYINHIDTIPLFIVELFIRNSVMNKKLAETDYLDKINVKRREHYSIYNFY